VLNIKESVFMQRFSGS